MSHKGKEVNSFEENPPRNPSDLTRLSSFVKSATDVLRLDGGPRQNVQDVTRRRQHEGR